MLLGCPARSARSVQSMQVGHAGVHATRFCSRDMHASCVRLLTGDQSLQKRYSRAKGARLPSYRG
jgi:hypothetical protein